MRTLLIRPGAIGDCLLHFPRMERLAQGYTEVWISRPVVPLVWFADTVRAIPDTGLDWLGLPGVEPPRPLLDSLRSFDVIHTWYGSSREDFRQALAGFPVVFHPAFEPSSDSLRLPFRGPAHGSVILHPFSSGARKNWPLENFRAIAANLEAAGRRIEWLAGPEEHLAEARRFDDLGALAQWISGAALYVGNDTGTTHLAAGLGVPTIAIFRATDPAIWAPRNPNVTILVNPEIDAVLHTANASFGGITDARNSALL